jgi:hypothetical protein
MKTNLKIVKIAIAAAVLAVGLPVSASAGEIWDWHGQSEKRLVETLGNPNNRITEQDNTRVYTYLFEHQVVRRIQGSPRSQSASRWVTERCQAEFQIGADNRVIGARFLGHSCDLKS